VFPKKEGGEEGEDKEKKREEKEGGGEEEYGRTRTMVPQDNVDLKAIDCNEDNSNRSDNNDQSNHGNYNCSGQKQQQQQSTDTGREASRMHADKYWNRLPNSTTPVANKEMTVLEMKQVSLLSLQPTTMHDRQSSMESFVVASGSDGRPLSHHMHRPSGHSLIDGHVDDPLPVSNNSRGGNGRAATMARMMNNASVAKPTWHKQEEEEKKEREGKGEGGDDRTRLKGNQLQQG
jgi:hypothetical protein